MADRSAEEAAELVSAVNNLLLPGEVRYTRAEVLERTGVDEELALRFWRAMGFVEVDPDERAFTDADIAMLRTAAGFVNSGVADEQLALQVTRTMSASLARIADAQVEAVREIVGAAADGVLGREAPAVRTALSDEELAQLAQVSENLLPVFEQVVLYMWRRHLAAAAERVIFRQWRVGDLRTALVVGFADLVGFTSLAQELDERELAAVVGRFEEHAYDVVTRGAGRVVKTVGDEVMFVSPDPAGACRIALGLTEVFAADPSLPDVRAGLAYGPLLSHQGDYFGPPVNFASRAVNVAYPGTVLASDELHQAASDAQGLRWKQLRAQRLKSFGRTRLWVVRSADGEA